MDDDFSAINQFINSTNSKIDIQNKLRHSNGPGNIEYPSETFLSNLDSSVKKNAAFVKKLKGPFQRESILNEIDKINLTKFLSEVASSITEAKFKLSDIPSVIELCTKLHHIYPDFNKQLLDHYSRNLPSIVVKKRHDLETPVKSPPCFTPPKFAINPNLSIDSSKARTDLRIVGKNYIKNASAIVMFCKLHGDDFMGLVEKDMLKLAREHQLIIPRNTFIPETKQEFIKMLVLEYYKLLLDNIIKMHEQYSNILKNNKKSQESKGEISKEVREKTDERYAECRKGVLYLEQLSELLDLPFPEILDVDFLKEDINETNTDCETAREVTVMSHSNVWDDGSTRSFYECLVDVRSFVPNITLRMQLETKNNQGNSTESLASSTEKNDEHNNMETEQDRNESSASDESINETDLKKETTTNKSSNTKNNNDIKTTMMQTNRPGKRNPSDIFFNKLSECYNKEMIDQATIEFLKHYNTKIGRKKLLKTLFEVKRTRLDLLPFFARMTANLNQCLPKIGNDLCLLLKQDFRKLFKKKDQINIESKVKNMRFIGELVTFNLFLRQEALNCLKILLTDFTHHHIEMSCNLLETCGRVLYRNQDTHHQVEMLLDQMMRKKLLLSVDSKYVTMIEDAYYFTKPAERVKELADEPTLHSNVKHLLYELLNRSTMNQVLEQLKKIDLNSKSTANFVINCMVEAHHLKFYNIRFLAALIAAIGKTHNWIPMAVIDGVVEDILLMTEVNEISFNQRRIPMIRFFAELFNYKLSDSSIVFKVLYSLITYNVHYPEPGYCLSQIPFSASDPPDNLFRIKLVVELLETCGEYLGTGADKKKLHCYLLFFQRYYWCKRYIYTLHPSCMASSGNQFPAAIEYLFMDVMASVSPNLVLAKSYDEARERVKKFFADIAAPSSSSSSSSLSSSAQQQRSTSNLLSS